MTLDDKGVLLIDAVRERGWNLYDSNSSGRDEELAKKALMQYPAETLNSGREYVLMPLTDKPNNPVEIELALEKVAVALDRHPPEISIHGMKHPLIGFRVLDRDIKIITLIGHVVDYKTAVESAKPIFNTGTMRYG